MVARTAEIDSMAFDVNVGLHSGISIKSSAVLIVVEFITHEL